MSSVFLFNFKNILFGYIKKPITSLHTVPSRTGIPVGQYSTKAEAFPSEQRLISALCVNFAEAESQEQMYYQANLLLPFVSHTLHQTAY